MNKKTRQMLDDIEALRYKGPKSFGITKDRLVKSKRGPVNFVPGKFKIEPGEAK